jgi:hypothetical protein
MQPQIIKPAKIANSWFYVVGLFFLCLNKIRHYILGYTTPRSFSFIDIPKAVAYDQEVVAKWEQYLRDYTGSQFTWEQKNVLELGPGADLGVGLILLGKGADKYNALDVHNLIKTTPAEFYDQLLATLPQASNKFFKLQLDLTLKGNNDKLNYLWQPDFDLSILKPENINLVVSQAAFEHFADVKKTISSLSQIVKPGTVLIAEIDLKTHTRWIRDNDPLNIYRYSENIYNFLKFVGSPNRLRPYQYEQLFKDNGWTNIQIRPEVILDQNYTIQVQPSLNKKFIDSKNQMEALSIIICATKL